MASYVKNTSISDSEGSSCGSDQDYEPFNGSRIGTRNRRQSKTIAENENIPNGVSQWNFKKSMDGAEKRPKRQPKCFSRNALMARENRLKKKMYIENLEREVLCLKADNKKMNGVVENQSFLIAELRKEIKYLKSVLANSADISRLIRNINQNTGMSVSSSLGTSLSASDRCTSKPDTPTYKPTHPWKDSQNYLDYASPDSYSTSPGTTESADLDLLLTDDILNNPCGALSESKPLSDILADDEISNLPVLHNLGEQAPMDTTTPKEEHNYTFPNEDTPDDIGVCLHVSKHKVSLEFCPSCSENASAAWEKLN